MNNRILVPLDGTPHAETALPYAAALAHTLQLPLVLLRAARPGLDLEEAAFYLEELRAWLAAAGVLATSVPAMERPAAASLEYIETRGVSCVVLASHNRRGLDRWRHGSVAHTLIHQAPVPLLVVRGAEPLARAASEQRPALVPASLRSVLVPLDGSALAEAILPVVNRLATGSDAAATLLRVVQPLGPVRPPPTFYSTTLSGEAMAASLEKQALQDAATYLEHMQGRLARAGITTTYTVRAGEAGWVIGAYAEEQAFDLVALATHGHTGVRRWLLGSVADHLLHSTTVPLLLLRPDPAALAWKPTASKETVDAQPEAAVGGSRSAAELVETAAERAGGEHDRS